MPDFVVVALVPIDTAIITADDEGEAVGRYELPEEHAGKDIFMYATLADEFFKEYRQRASAPALDLVLPADE